MAIADHIPSQTPYNGANPMNGQAQTQPQNLFASLLGKHCKLNTDLQNNPLMVLAQTNGHESTCVWFDSSGKYCTGLFPLSALAFIADDVSNS